MSKTLIHLIGNIASGKSTLIQTLKAHTKTAEYFCIDEYRRQYQAFTQQGEENAWEALRRDLRRPSLAVLETSGTSANVARLHFDAKLQAGDQLIVVLLRVPAETCIRRAHHRLTNGYAPPPTPYGFALEDSIRFIDKKLKGIPCNRIIDGTQSPKAVADEFLSLFKK